MKFVSKELAIKLKEKGFDKPCFGWYDTENGYDDLILNTTTIINSNYKELLESTNDIDIIIDAPTIDQTLEWLREKDIYIWIEPYNAFTTENHLAFLWNITLGKSFKSKEQLFDKDTFYTHIHLDIEHWEINYDDACIAGIEYVIDNLI